MFSLRRLIPRVRAGNDFLPPPIATIPGNIQ